MQLPTVRSEIFTDLSVLLLAIVTVHITATETISCVAFFLNLYSNRYSMKDNIDTHTHTWRTGRERYASVS